MDLLPKQEQEEFKKLNSVINSRAVYDWAKSQGNLTEVNIKYGLVYNIEKGEYLVLSQDLLPRNELDARRWIELMEKDNTTGYCSCDFLGINHPCAFIIGKNIPKEFQDYVAIHEIFEGEDLPRSFDSYQTHMCRTSEDGIDFKLPPPEISSHRFAYQIELMNVFLKGKDFSLKYMSWVPNEYFENADPDFFKERKRNDMNPLELTANFIELIASFDKED